MRGVQRASLPGRERAGAVSASEQPAGARSAPSRSGTVVIDGRYELGPVIGAGAMGEVRRARDLRLGRDVAVKLLRPALAVETKARQRFAEEASAAARLSHPNVVTVYDSGEHEGDPYIVMECLPGRTLADELASGDRLDDDRVRVLGREILAALGAAHELGIVHRDVKPGNVLLAADGRAMVADFGIAKTAEGLDLTITGQLVGTPSYMAPERLEGRSASPSTDLFAVGVLLYEAAGGRKPFAGDTPMEMARAITAGEPADLTEVCPGIDAGLAAAIHRALARRPEDRFASAREMAAALAGMAPAVGDTRVAGGSVPGGSTADRTVADVGPGTLVDGRTLVDRPPTVTDRRRLGRVWPDRRLMATGAVATVLVVVLMLLLVGGGDGGGGGETPQPSTLTSTAPAQSSLPAGLDGALERLEQLVRP